jgi:hypothetical protein
VVRWGDGDGTTTVDIGWTDTGLPAKKTFTTKTRSREVEEELFGRLFGEFPDSF